MKFLAFVAEEIGGKIETRIVEKNADFLPKGDLLISVKYSSLNYKDALSATGHKGVTKRYPHIPGIDAGGIVVKSNSKLFSEGDEVIVTGFELGADVFGGFSEYVSVPSEWVLKLPNGLSLKEAMVYGTAGFTAALSLFRIEKNSLSKKEDEFLVTGATGGVGSMSIAILRQAGYKNITAATGKIDKENFLKQIGANNVINREALISDSVKPLMHEKWGSVIDVVGGNILEQAIKATKTGGAIAICGLISNNSLNLSVYPLILRGVSLLGIDSAHCNMEIRKEVWNRLANDWKVKNLDVMYNEISLNELNDKIKDILNGKVVGRILINIGDN